MFSFLSKFNIAQIKFSFVFFWVYLYKEYILFKYKLTLLLLSNVVFNDSFIGKIGISPFNHSLKFLCFDVANAESLIPFLI